MNNSMLTTSKTSKNYLICLLAKNDPDKFLKISQTELEKLKHTHATKMAESREELKTKLDKLSRDLDVRWTETLR